MDWRDALETRIMELCFRLGTRPLTDEEKRIVRQPGIREETISRYEKGLMLDEEQKLVLNYLMTNGYFTPLNEHGIRYGSTDHAIDSRSRLPPLSDHTPDGSTRACDG